MHFKETIRVLDKGFVQIIDSMGDDLVIVNSAKISKNRNSNSLTKSGKQLISNLAEWNHWTPFSHLVVRMKIKMPIFIARQYFKTQVGFTRNEESRRSVIDLLEFYLPSKLNCPDIKDKNFLYNDISMHYEKDIMLYEKLLLNGVPPEQARIVLPQSMYTTFIETGNLSGYARLYNLRIKPDAQWEIQQYAKAIGEIMSKIAPISWKELTKNT